MEKQVGASASESGNSHNHPDYVTSAKVLLKFDAPLLNQAERRLFREASRVIYNLWTGHSITGVHLVTFSMRAQLMTLCFDNAIMNTRLIKVRIKGNALKVGECL